MVLRDAFHAHRRLVVLAEHLQELVVIPTEMNEGARIRESVIGQRGIPAVRSQVTFTERRAAVEAGRDRRWLVSMATVAGNAGLREMLQDWLVSLFVLPRPFDAIQTFSIKHKRRAAKTVCLILTMCETDLTKLLVISLKPTLILSSGRFLKTSLQMGHTDLCLVSQKRLMQSRQKLCPHGMDVGFLKQSRQMQQRNCSGDKAEAMSGKHGVKYQEGRKSRECYTSVLHIILQIS